MLTLVGSRVACILRFGKRRDSIILGKIPILRALITRWKSEYHNALPFHTNGETRTSLLAGDQVIAFGSYGIPTFGYNSRSLLLKGGRDDGVMKHNHSQITLIKQLPHHMSQMVGQMGSLGVCIVWCGVWWGKGWHEAQAPSNQVKNYKQT